MKMLTKLTTVTLLFTSMLYAVPDTNTTNQDPYNNTYCHDPVEVEKWNNIIEKDGDNNMVQALHSLWLGLCAKVEAKDFTTKRAQKIFEDAKNSLLKTMEKYGAKGDEKVEL